VNAKRVCRLYREMGLQLRNKSPKRRVKAQLREDRSAASAANQVWAMDFVHDQRFDGRKIRVLTMVDTFSRLSPAIDVLQSYRGSDVVETLERVIREVGCQRRSGSTLGLNLSAGSSIYGPSCATSRSTSAGAASRPTTLSSKA
jgi:putative transposase